MSLNSRSFEEKRNFIRMSMNASAELIVQGGKAIDVTCIDLSANGMAVKTTTDVAVGTELQVNIQSPNAQFNSMVANGIVVRREVIAEDQYELGIELHQIA